MSFANTSFTYDDTLRLGLSIWENGQINVDIYGSVATPDFMREALITNGNNISSYNLVDNGVDIYYSTIMYGKGLMHGFVVDELVGEGVFETVDSTNNGSVGVIEYSYLSVSLVDHPNTYEATESITENTTQTYHFTETNFVDTITVTDTETHISADIGGFPLSFAILAMIPAVVLYRRRRLFEK